MRGGGGGIVAAIIVIAAGGVGIWYVLKKLPDRDRDRMSMGRQPPPPPPVKSGAPPVPPKDPANIGYQGSTYSNPDFTQARRGVGSF